jgi:hypothetical protein
VPPSKFANLVVMVREEAHRTGKVSESYIKRLINLLK